MLLVGEVTSFLNRKCLECEALDEVLDSDSTDEERSTLPKIVQVPHNNVSIRIDDPANNPTPVSKYSCAFSLVFTNPDAAIKTKPTKSYPEILLICVSTSQQCY